MINTIEAGNVNLLPGLFTERSNLNRKYLLSLENKNLLQNYYWEAGIIYPDLTIITNPETTNIHWGWEAPICQLRGHFLGHWLSAASVLIATNDDAELKAKLDNIIEELDRCQKLNGGKWVGPFPEKYFSKLETEEYIWSPQYTMHKLILGLIHANVYAGNRKALSILNNLADWYIKWTDKVLKGDCPDAIYKGEQAGMLEVWAQLYSMTGKAKYQTLTERYSNPSIFEALMEGNDPLTNSHQNASIPYAHGAAKLYETTGDKKYLDILERFWKCAVTDRESYCTGGQGAGEFWTPPHQAGSFIGERNQEFCTVYNMLRVADYLFRFTGNATYLDYIEKNIYNGFLAQQNKFNGMPTYFLPMKAGSKKTWGSPTKDFWCCHGTMIQAQTLYPQLCYYQADEEPRIFVSQYIPSEGKFTIGENKVSITQTVNMKFYNATALFDDNKDSQNSRWIMRFQVKGDCEFTLSFRIPSWIAGKPSVTVNGVDIDVPGNCDKCGFLNIKKTWKDEEVIVYLPAAVTEASLSDMPEKAAVMEGPIVLAGISDNDYGIKAPAGIPSVLRKAQEHTYSTFSWQQSTYRTVSQDRETTFVPLYEVTDENYTVYWTKK